MKTTMLKKMRLFQIRDFNSLFQSCIILLFIVLINPTNVKAQYKEGSNLMPSFKGGNKALREFINKNLNYPVVARNAGISGTVMVNYMITKDGKVQDIKVMQGLSRECDEEAIRVTGLITGWTPGMRQGKPVNFMSSMPVEFQSDQKVKPVKISGKVTEKITGQAVEGAFVIVRGTNVGTVTNEEGGYLINLPSESQEVEVFSVGYLSKIIPIDYHSTINVELDPEIFIIDFNSSDNY